MSDLYSLVPSTIVVYSKSWCPDCRRSRLVLENNNVAFIEVDVDQDAAGKAFLRHINHGNESVPTIIFPDGTILVEPVNSALVSKISNN
jgi:mycoredoxin